MNERKPTIIENEEITLINEPILRTSPGARLDDQTTMMALRRHVKLFEFESLNEKKADELARNFSSRVAELCKQDQMHKWDAKKRVEVMKEIRKQFGELQIFALCLANALNMDMTKTVFDELIVYSMQSRQKKDVKLKGGKKEELRAEFY